MIQWCIDASIDDKLVSVAMDEGVTCVEVHDQLDTKCEASAVDCLRRSVAFFLNFPLLFTSSMMYSFTGSLRTH